MREEDIKKLVNVGDYAYIYNYDGMKDCKHIGQVTKIYSAYGSGYVTLKGVIKLSSNKLIFKENTNLDVWDLQPITQVEYMALIDCYKRHEKMRATIKTELSKFHKLAKRNH